jgi:hypothetical protein
MSHVSMKFIDSADMRHIIPLILPPHLTHRLQPLDVGLFSSLGKAYSTEFNNLMHKSLGLVSMTKRLFWPLFRTAWETASLDDLASTNGVQHCLTHFFLQFSGILK